MPRRCNVAAALRVARHEAQRILLEKAARRFFDNSKGRLLPPLIVAHCPALKQEILFCALETLDHVDLLHPEVCEHVDEQREQRRQDRRVHVGRRRGSGWAVLRSPGSPINR